LTARPDPEIIEGTEMAAGPLMDDGAVDQRVSLNAASV
jgi:hypothetical protein